MFDVWYVGNCYLLVVDWVVWSVLVDVRSLLFLVCALLVVRCLPIVVCRMLCADCCVLLQFKGF